MQLEVIVVPEGNMEFINKVLQTLPGLRSRWRCALPFIYLLEACIGSCVE